MSHRDGLALRSLVYHEILSAYLNYVKARGYTSMFIWACPPMAVSLSICSIQSNMQDHAPFCVFFFVFCTTSNNTQSSLEHRACPTSVAKCAGLRKHPDC